MKYLARINSKETLLNYENSILKSNEISMSKLSHGLSLNQMQLLAYAIYSTQKDGNTAFRKADFEKKFDLEYKTEHAKQDAQKISQLQFSIIDLENDYFEFWNVFNGIKYEHGKFTFRWSTDFIPHILELKEKFITTDLTIASQFNSSFSWTLYDYLQAHYGYWHKPISKEAIMRLFGVENKKTYKENTGRFKKTVLDVAIKEINALTDLEVRYNEEREGRTIIGFDLIWSNGKKLSSATKKQIKEIQSILDIVFEDMFQYININDENDRQRAIDLIREIENMREFTGEPICITKEKADDLIKKAVWNFKQLNGLLQKNHKVLSPESAKKVQFYNWLEDRS